MSHVSVSISVVAHPLCINIKARMFIPVTLCNQVDVWIFSVAVIASANFCLMGSSALVSTLPSQAEIAELIM